MLAGFIGACGIQAAQQYPFSHVFGYASKLAGILFEKKARFWYTQQVRGYLYTPQHGRGGQQQLPAAGQACS